VITIQEKKKQVEKPTRTGKLAMKTHIYELTGSCNSASSQAPQPPSSQPVDLPALSKNRFVT